MRPDNKQKQKIGFSMLVLSALLVTSVLMIILGHIAINGIGAISLDFLIKAPTNGMTEGGIFPAIIGTVGLTIITAVFSIPLGMGCAIYLNEYAIQNLFTRLIRISIRNLAGIPSIVYGLFGVIFFVQLMRLDTSILSAGLTLGLMTLPWIITASEEALKNIPQSYRDGALALGATRWQAIRTNVVPYSIPGMLTGAILGLSRAAGETAPILFTGVAFYLPFLPDSVFSQFMALPYHLYIMSTQHHDLQKAKPIAYGTALVLVLIILLMNMAAILIRYRLRKFKKE